jgi:hypothetical protein
MRGISITNPTGIGDVVQFSSLPENYFRHTGKKLVDVSRAWVFDHNPYVTRNVEAAQVTELWLNWKCFTRPGSYLSVSANAPDVFLSNAEHHANLLGTPVILNRPRLYRFEDWPFKKRKKILFHPIGRSHGPMPDQVIEHVLNKYKETDQLYQIGEASDPDYGIPRIATPTIWDLAAVISEARMLIGVDSGPAWIAACYPDVVVKRVRTRPSIDSLKTWVPLEMANIHSHWDDPAFQTFNSSEDDVGFTQSYRKI